MAEKAGKQVLVGGLDVATDRIELPVMSWNASSDDAVTGHADAPEDLSPEAQRKRLQREREKAAGVEVFELKFSPYERAELDEGRAGRGSKGDPYTTTEYIKTLIRNDVKRLRVEQGRLTGRICKNCQKPLPRGCAGVWSGERLCLLARSEAALEL
ncbi:hypothetical protein [Pseudomonas viridiflava]|uniref:hypothetical protein n=1 Tax=Pseudomonas viridiflava TaxID=33069 RepID=UPI000F015365|nr:hypothetical protein [Pseudomonas viridiflava]